KKDFSYFANTRNTVRFGAQALLFDFLPYDATGKFENTAEIKIVSDHRYGVEYSAYVSAEHKFSPELSAEAGLRVSLYTFMGPGKAYYYGDTVPNEPLPFQRTETY